MLDTVARAGRVDGILCGRVLCHRKLPEKNFVFYTKTPNPVTNFLPALFSLTIVSDPYITGGIPGLSHLLAFPGTLE